MNTDQIILEELRSLRATVEELAVDSRQRITALETKTLPLFDNGQPGRCSRMDARVTKLEHWQLYVMGAAGAVSFIVALVLKLF